MKKSWTVRRRVNATQNRAHGQPGRGVDDEHPPRAPAFERNPHAGGKPGEVLDPVHPPALAVGFVGPRGIQGLGDHETQHGQPDPKNRKLQQFGPHDEPEPVRARVVLRVVPGHQRHHKTNGGQDQTDDLPPDPHAPDGPRQEHKMRAHDPQCRHFRRMDFQPLRVRTEMLQRFLQVRVTR